MNKFTFILMNKKADVFLDSILRKALNSGIKSVSAEDDYYLDITFNDGSHMKAWNVNKYCAWLYKGVFTYPNKEDGKYEWTDTRPKRHTMARLYKMLGEVSYHSES